MRALYEGDAIEPWETVMTIEGDYALFAHLETVYLGAWRGARWSCATSRDVVEAAHGKPILFFPARHDHWLVQTGDGWAAHVGGRSACPPTRRPRGGAAAGSARSRTG